MTRKAPPVLLVAAQGAACSHEPAAPPARPAAQAAPQPDCAALLGIALPATAIGAARAVDAGAGRAGDLPMPPHCMASAEFTATHSTDYAAFKARGVGTGDALPNANGTRRRYERLSEAHGGVAETQRFARCFQVPGMGHCGGGPSLDRFDAFGALVDWVEQGRPPARLRATGAAFAGRSRPLCPHPQRPRCLGTGDTHDAASFRCA